MCRFVDEIFASHVLGQEPECYDDILAGFNATPRGNFRFGWALVRGLIHDAGKDRNRESICIEVKLKNGDDELFEVDYFLDTDTWKLEGSTKIGNDGTEAIRSLARDCQISAGDWRLISEHEAMMVIAMLAGFFMSQPVTA